jgi:hypothetical protein
MNLQQYMRYFISRQLNVYWYDLDDCIQYVTLLILENRQKKPQTKLAVRRLIPYLYSNKVPKDKGILKTLRSIMWRGRMKYMQTEDRARTGSWGIRYFDDDIQEKIKRLEQLESI